MFWGKKKKKDETDMRSCMLRDENGKCALVAPGGDGRPLTAFVYDEIRRFQCDGFNYYICQTGTKLGLLELDGTQVVPCEMDKIEVFHDVIILKREEKWGVYCPTGTYVPPIYDEITEDDSYLMVRMGETEGYIDSDTGQFVSGEGDAVFEHPLLVFLK